MMSWVEEEPNKGSGGEGYFSVYTRTRTGTIWICDLEHNFSNFVIFLAHLHNSVYTVGTHPLRILSSSTLPLSSPVPGTRLRGFPDTS